MNKLVKIILICTELCSLVIYEKINDNKYKGKLRWFKLK